MKKLLYSPLFFLLAGSLLTGKADAQSLLWKVSGKKAKKESYLYGTMHVADSRVYNFSDAVLPAFESCPGYAMELIPDQAASLKLMSMMMLDSLNLKDLFQPEEYEQLETYFQDSLGQPLALYSKFKPFFIMAIMAKGEFGSEMEDALDLYFFQKAKEAEKTLTGLETIEEQMGAVNSISYDDQVKSIMDMLNGESKDESQTEALMRFYSAGQLDSLAVLGSQMDMGPEFQEEFLRKRNVRMVDRLLPLIKEEPTFIAVGALHLPGEEGIIEILRKRGYTVEPVLN